MYSDSQIVTNHKDLIHDIAFDIRGRRMATCSSDQTVNVFDLKEDGDEWILSASWKAHSAAVWKVNWAHPEFGQVIATCSFDRSASIWEELAGDSAKGRENHWVQRANLLDFRSSVKDARFAPKHLGLKLACCSSDGTIIIYEAPNVMDLKQWIAQSPISCGKVSLSSICWSTAKLYPPLIAAGSDDSNPVPKRIFMYEYNVQKSNWSTVDLQQLVVTEPVHDLSFAPNIGRSFHLLAVASRDSRCVIFTNIGVGQQNYKIESNEGLEKSQIWRVSWNVTGTILAASDEDGMVTLWKANHMGQWKQILQLNGDGKKVPSEALPPASTAPFRKLGLISNPSEVIRH